MKTCKNLVKTTFNSLARLNKPLLISGLIVSSLALQSCGGGGGSSTPPPPAPKMITLTFNATFAEGKSSLHKITIKGCNQPETYLNSKQIKTTLKYNADQKCNSFTVQMDGPLGKGKTMIHISPADGSILTKPADIQRGINMGGYTGFNETVAIDKNKLTFTELYNTNTINVRNKSEKENITTDVSSTCFTSQSTMSFPTKMDDPKPLQLQKAPCSGSFNFKSTSNAPDCNIDFNKGGTPSQPKATCTNPLIKWTWEPDTHLLQFDDNTTPGSETGYYVESGKIYQTTSASTKEVIIDGLNWAGFDTTSLPDGFWSKTRLTQTDQDLQAHAVNIPSFLSMLTKPDDPLYTSKTTIDTKTAVTFKTIRLPIAMENLNDINDHVAPGLGGWYDHPSIKTCNDSNPAPPSCPFTKDPIFYSCGSPSSGVKSVEGKLISGTQCSIQESLFKFIGALKTKHIKVLIDIHGMLRNKTQDGWPNSSQSGDFSTYKEDLTNFLKALKNQNLDNVIGIDVYNEPFVTEKLDDVKLWGQLVGTAANIVYTNAPNLLLFVEGTRHGSANWGESLQDIANTTDGEFTTKFNAGFQLATGKNKAVSNWLIGDSKTQVKAHLVYSPHVYGQLPSGGVNQSKTQLDSYFGYVIDQNKYPVVIGETGFGNDEVNSDFLYTTLFHYLRNKSNEQVPHNVFYWEFAPTGGDTNNIITSSKDSPYWSSMSSTVMGDLKYLFTGVKPPPVERGPLIGAFCNTEADDLTVAGTTNPGVTYSAGSTISHNQCKLAYATGKNTLVKGGCSSGCTGDNCVDFTFNKGSYAQTQLNQKGACNVDPNGYKQESAVTKCNNFLTKKLPGDAVCFTYPPPAAESAIFTVQNKSANWELMLGSNLGTIKPKKQIDNVHIKKGINISFAMRNLTTNQTISCPDLQLKGPYVTMGDNNTCPNAPPPPTYFGTCSKDGTWCGADFG